MHNKYIQRNTIIKDQFFTVEIKLIWFAWNFYIEWFKIKVMAIISCNADDKYAIQINKNCASNVVPIGCGSQKNEAL